jgi:hypothetical protein
LGNNIQQWILYFKSALDQMSALALSRKRAAERSRLQPRVSLVSIVIPCRSRLMYRLAQDYLVVQAGRHGVNLGIHLGTFILYSMYSSPNRFSNPGSSEYMK